MTDNSALSWGIIGHTFVIAAFIVAIFSVILNLVSARLPEDRGWQVVSRNVFSIAAALVTGVFILMLVLLFTKQGGYQFVDAFLKSKLSLWSFLLGGWMGKSLLLLFAVAIGGVVVIFLGKKWANYALCLLSVALVFLALSLIELFAPKSFYLEEELWWGNAGHLFVILALVAACFSVVVNFIRTRRPDDPALKIIGREFFTVHAFAVFGIFATLLLMLISHRFEYQYVWQHSKRGMSMNYVLACLWEGQEGSTLLWLFWHSVLGLILMFRAKDWEAPVLAVLSLVQVCLSMMLLGFYIGHTHIGTNPFELIRMREENIGLPWTKLPDYLAKIPLFHDGRGLNPLLQNYWMTIHPPTLFCGFALTTIPFTFAIAGLWTKRYHEWQKAALPWAFIGIMVLGTGILMGGAWAYESLSFGGFWAWDPVENASLVPWLVLVGAAHVMLVYRIKGQSLFTTFFLTIAAFLLIVYSTFLTKSGILSDTSVHAFTEDGLNEELTFFMGFFLWLATMLLAGKIELRIIYTVYAIAVLILFFVGYHAGSMLMLLGGSAVTMLLGYILYFPKEEKEEELWSREFWMFIGALVLFLSAMHIIYNTSMPVTNKFMRVITGTEGKKSLGNDAVYFYNTWQSAFAFIICALVAASQFFKYKKTDPKEFWRGLRVPMLASAVVTTILVLVIYFNSSWATLGKHQRSIDILCTFTLFTIFFAIFANGKYWLKVLGGKIKNAGASIAHIGFAVLLLGVVISTSKKDTISRNSSQIDVRNISSEGNNEVNIYLRKGDTLPMGNYDVTYSSRERKFRNGTPYVYFHVDFIPKGEKQKAFTLSPFIQLNPFMGNAAEPDTRHYLYKDIYTFVKFAPMSSLNDSTDKDHSRDNLYDKPQNHTIGVSDTIAVENCIAILDSITKVKPSDSLAREHEVGVAGHFRVYDESMQEKQLITYYFLDTLQRTPRYSEAVDDAAGIKVTLWNLRPQTGKFDVYTSVKFSKKADFIVMEASIFPAINVLWLGCVVMVFGTFIAVRERLRKNKISS